VSGETLTARTLTAPTLTAPTLAARTLAARTLAARFLLLSGSGVVGQKILEGSDSPSVIFFRQEKNFHDHGATRGKLLLLSIRAWIQAPTGGAQRGSSPSVGIPDNDMCD